MQAQRGARCHLIVGGEDGGEALAGFQQPVDRQQTTDLVVLTGHHQRRINSISGQGFTGIYALRGKYRVTVVLEGLPLRRADGSVLPNLSVVVPTVLSESGSVAASKTISGPGLVGYITLTD